MFAMKTSHLIKNASTITNVKIAAAFIYLMGFIHIVNWPAVAPSTFIYVY